MDFRIADTFTDSLAKRTGDEQKAVKTTAFDLQLNPANPGMQFHKLNAALTLGRLGAVPMTPFLSTRCRQTEALRPRHEYHVGKEPAFFRAS